MPATSLSEVKNIAPAVERAIAAAFASVGGKPVIPRSQEDDDDIFIIPNFNCGPSADHFFKRPDGHFDDDLFKDCTIEWNLSVPRLPDGRMPLETLASTYDLFSQELTRIKLAMDPSRWDFINGQLPFHKLTRIRPRGEQKGFEQESGSDGATIRFACWVGILPEAWPTDLNAYKTLTL